MQDIEQIILAAAKRSEREYHFMICDMCFWCASVFGLNLSKYRSEFLCPVCKGSKVHTIPLESVELLVEKCY